MPKPFDNLKQTDTWCLVIALVSRLMWKLGGSLPVFIEAVHSIPLDTLSAR
jgi:hypothetical protein